MTEIRLFVCSILITCIWESGFAGFVSENKARKVALGFYQSVLQNDANYEGAQAKLVYTAQCSLEIDQDDQMPMLYVYAISKGGFVIVSGDDRVDPILAYSRSGSFPSGPLPSSVREWLATYAQQIRISSLQENLPSKEVVEAWEALLTGQTTRAESIIGNGDTLITTQWGQGLPYSGSCPGSAPAGCIAVAMAQVMKYHGFPYRGKGAHIYYNNTFGIISAEFERATYAWDSMPNRLNKHNHHVADLIFHCGVAVETNYDTNGSGATLESVVSAFAKYFDYDNEVRLVARSAMDSYVWSTILRGELDARQPVIYGGYGTQTGHAFVIDGYRYEKFHINWGWNGDYNGYYSLNILQPQVGEIFGKDQKAIIGLVPKLQSWDCYEPNNTQIDAYSMSLEFQNEFAILKTEGAGSHLSTDFDFYKINLPRNYSYRVKARVHDLKWSGNGKKYTNDVSFAYLFGESSRFGPFDDKMDGVFTVQGGQLLYFEVNPICISGTGTYELEIEIERLSFGELLNGQVNTITGEPRSHVTLILNDSNVRKDTILSSSKGKFTFDKLQDGNRYQLQARDERAPREGVTTNDIIAIQRHILGLEPFSCPWQYVAADVNRSGTITNADVTEVRRLILGITSKFKQADSWVFFPIDYQFPEGEYFPVPDVAVTFLKSAVNETVRLSAIKMGDVDCLKYLQSGREDRNRFKRGQLSLRYQTIFDAEKNLYYIYFLAVDTNAITGLQFSMQYSSKKFEFYNILPNSIIVDENHLSIEELDESEVIHFSWSDGGVKKLKEGEKLFCLVLSSHSTGRPELEISEHWSSLPAQAYSANHEVLDLAISDEAQRERAIDSVFILYQNYPNPVQDKTTISFFTECARLIMIRILDLAGMELFQFKTSVPAGLSEIPIDGSIFPFNGLYIYSVEAAGIFETKKLLVCKAGEDLNRPSPHNLRN